MSDDNFLTTLDTLNEQQKKAVLNISGSLLVCAGAGSGKTRIIAYRVAYLINHCNTRPDSIVALTFTNKAAREMKERINLLLGTESSKKPIITTFHGYALLIIRKKFGNTQPWSIIDENDQQALMSRVIKEYGPVPPSITPKKVLHYISGMKNGIYSAQNIIHDSHYELLRNRYEVEKQKSYSYDFDDLLILLLTFLDDPHFLLELRLQVRHLLIDEYQDTNSIQHAIVKKLHLIKEETW